MKKNYVVMDGNTAAAYSAYAFTEVAAIYPITPSSPMAEKVDEWSAKGKKNLFGSTVDVIQMQSEAGAAGTCHGSLQAGALTTTFTSSQGLMLMIPAMYAMGGQFLPSVMHIASRVVTSNHHSIFGDHTDFMTCRMTGYAMLMSSCPQEAMDLAAVAHLSAISGRYAFMHCFDGFRTSHEMQRIEALDYEDLRGLVDQEALQAFRHQSLNPEHPTNRGNNVNPDVYFQCKEGANVKANALPDTVQHYMDEINKLTGRDYKLFNYYGAPDAEEVIVVMCSASETVKETVDYLNAQGRKVGMVQIHLFRPFSVKHFAAAIPTTCKRIAVLDRNKETGSVGEPVYLDVVTALNQAGRGDIRVVGGRYGLSSKDTTPGQIVAVYDNLKQETPKNNFTIGINDDVTYTSLDYKEIELAHPGQISCKLWGLGGDGTVGANKNAISTIGFVGGKYAQAYFSYDTMKSGGLTQSHLRFGDEPIRSTYLVSSADFVAVHAPTYVKKYDTTEDLKEGGTFLLNCPWTVEELDAHLPAKMKRDLARKHANFYIIDAAKLAQEIGLGKRTNNILQGAFFALTKVIPMDLAIEEEQLQLLLQEGRSEDRGPERSGRGSGCQRRCEGGDPRLLGRRTGRSRRGAQGPHSLRPGHRHAHGPSKGRSAPRFRVPEVRRSGRHLGKRNLRVLQARCRHQGPQVGWQQVHPVQPLLHVLPPCRYPPRAADRGGEEVRSRRVRDCPRQGSGQGFPLFLPDAGLSL